MGNAIEPIFRSCAGLGEDSIYCRRLVMPSRKNKLLALDSGTLADALLELSARYPDVDDYIERLLASPEESVVRFKLKVAALHGMSDFIGYSDSHDFSNKLSEMLDELSKSMRSRKPVFSWLLLLLRPMERFSTVAMTPAA